MYVCHAEVTPVYRIYEKSSAALGAEVAGKIIRECGEPDALIVSTYLSRIQEDFHNLGVLIAEYLGLETEVYEVSSGDGSGGAAISLAEKLIKSGIKKVLVVGVDKSNDFHHKHAVKHLQTLIAPYEAVYGLTYAGAHALATRLYMRRFNVTEEELALWPVTMHSHAIHVPHAMLRFPITVEKVVRSQVVASPITLLHSHPFSDGAAAIMFTSESTPIEVRTAASSSKLTLADRDLTFMESARRAMEKLGNPKIEALEVHDPFTIAGIVALESLGIAERGKALKFLDQNLEVVNPSGGLKARGHPIGATGVYQVAEGYMAITRGLGILGKVKSFLAQSSNMMGASTYLTYMREV